jgi:hypothetical protein
LGFLVLSVVFGRFYDYPEPIFKFVTFYTIACVFMSASYVLYIKIFRDKFAYFSRTTE